MRTPLVVDKDTNMSADPSTGDPSAALRYYVNQWADREDDTRVVNKKLGESRYGIEPRVKTKRSRLQVMADDADASASVATCTSCITWIVFLTSEKQRLHKRDGDGSGSRRRDGRGPREHGRGAGWRWHTAVVAAGVIIGAVRARARAPAPRRRTAVLLFALLVADRGVSESGGCERDREQREEWSRKLHRVILCGAREGRKEGRRLDRSCALGDLFRNERQGWRSYSKSVSWRQPKRLEESRDKRAPSQDHDPLRKTREEMEAARHRRMQRIRDAHGKVGASIEKRRAATLQRNPVFVLFFVCMISGLGGCELYT